MNNADKAERQYSLICQRCQRVWDATYTVLAYHDADGDHELFFRHGTPAMPPWTHPTCPVCGGQRVRVLPGGSQSPLG